MAVSEIKSFIVTILIIIFVVRQVECITQSQEFKLTTIHEPWCTLKCDIFCGAIINRDEFIACVNHCKKTSC